MVSEVVQDFVHPQYHSLRAGTGFMEWAPKAVETHPILRCSCDHGMLLGELKRRKRGVAASMSTTMMVSFIGSLDFLLVNFIQ